MSQSSAPGAHVVELAETAAGVHTDVHMGQQLRLTLAETRTTGYRWHLAEACPSILAVEDETGTAPDGPPGAPGQRVWTFRTTAPGTCQLRLASARSWEKTETGKVLTFPVTVLP